MHTTDYLEQFLGKKYLETLKIPLMTKCFVKIKGIHGKDEENFYCEVEYDHIAYNFKLGNIHTTIANEFQRSINYAHENDIDDPLIILEKVKNGTTYKWSAKGCSTNEYILYSKICMIRKFLLAFTVSDSEETKKDLTKEFAKEFKKGYTGLYKVGEFLKPEECDLLRHIKNKSYFTEEL